MRGRRRDRAPKHAPEVWFPAQLEELLAEKSSWLDVWQRMARETGFLRPPLQVPAIHRSELLRSLPSMLEEESYLGHSLPTSTAFGRIARMRDDQEREALCQLHAGQLHAQLVRLILTKAEVQALRSPVEAGELVQLARLFALVLAEEDEEVATVEYGCRLDGLCLTVETSAVRAEVESVAGLLAALQGEESAARRRLEVASAILETPRQLAVWGRTRSGRLRQAEVPRFDLRGHARWLGCASKVEASLGELVAARRLARDAEELYLQARAPFAAGLQAYQLARLASWQAKPEQAAEEFERAFQLLDLRTAPRLRRRLLVELAFAYFDAGGVVRGNEEMEIARRLEAQASDVHAARGLLFLKTGEPQEGRRWLHKARQQASSEAVRGQQVLTLDLVEAERPWPSSERPSYHRTRRAGSKTRSPAPRCAADRARCTSVGSSSRPRCAPAASIGRLCASCAPTCSAPKPSRTGRGRRLALSSSLPSSLARTRPLGPVIGVDG